MSPAPTILEVITQKTESDCAIASLAMLLGKPYAAVSAAALEAAKMPHKTGLYMTQVVKIAKHLGFTLKRAPKGVDLTEETGLLGVEFEEKKDRHVVVLFEGVVVDPSNGLLYAPDVFLNLEPMSVTGVWRVI